jgi:hypothetical protein
MQRIFICYRRDDAPHAAGRIGDHLARRFGDKSVFRDVDVLEAGVDYAHRIMNAILTSDVVLGYRCENSRMRDAGPSPDMAGVRLPAQTVSR